MIAYRKKKDIYKVIRITGSQNNILGIEFDTSNNMKVKNEIEVIEWHYQPERERLTSTTEVLNQVIEGLEIINKRLGSNYKLSKIYYDPVERSASNVYAFLIIKLISHYHEGKPFIEST